MTIWRCSQFTVSYGKKTEIRRALSLVLNVGKYSEDVTSDGSLFQVLAAVMGMLGC